jgi:hypothetical protein
LNGELLLFPLAENNLYQAPVTITIATAIDLRIRKDARHLQYHSLVLTPSTNQIIAASRTACVSDPITELMGNTLPQFTSARPLLVKGKEHSSQAKGPSRRPQPACVGVVETQGVVQRLDSRFLVRMFVQASAIVRARWKKERARKIARNVSKSISGRYWMGFEGAC